MRIIYISFIFTASVFCGIIGENEFL